VRSGIMTATASRLHTSRALMLLLASGANAYTLVGTHGSPYHRRAAHAKLTENVVIPACFPTLGFTEREQIRFRHMILVSEPLPHEVFGLQVLLGAVGSQAAGFVGCLMGTFQIAPCLCWLPGRFGDSVRIVGWHAFAALRSCARTGVGLWRASGIQASAASLIAATRRFDRDVKASARAGAVCMAVLRLAWRVLVAGAATVATAGGAARRVTSSRGGVADTKSAPGELPRASDD